MRRFVGLAILLAIFSLAAFAQEGMYTAPKAEIFGGSQYTRFHGGASFNGASGTGNGLALMFGGGVDVAATRRFAFRAIQFDWLSLHANGTSDNNNMRLSTGILLRY